MGSLAQLVDDLAKSGCSDPNLKSIAKAKDYGIALPILIHWLNRLDDQREVQQVVSALATPRARPVAAPALIAAFRKVDSDTVRWSIGNALEFTADDSVFDDLAQLIADPQYGIARQMLLLAIGKSTRAQAFELLAARLGDPDLEGHAVIGLGRLKDPRAMACLEPYIKHKRAWIRKEARDAIERIRRAASSFEG